MKNYQIEGKDGKMYWVHRAIAVSVFIGKLIGDEMHILALQRGSGTPDFQGLWCCPCGYLDFDETLVESACREVKEETGIIINPSSLDQFYIADKPSQNLQNVTVRFTAIMNTTDKQHPIIGTEGEENEVADAQWIPLSDIDDLLWAFDHDNIIKALFY